MVTSTASTIRAVSASIIQFAGVLTRSPQCAPRASGPGMGALLEPHAVVGEQTDVLHAAAEAAVQQRVQRKLPGVAGLALAQAHLARLFPALVGAVARVPPRRAVDRLAAARAPRFPLRRPAWYVRPLMRSWVGRAGVCGLAGHIILEVAVSLTAGVDSYCDYSTLVGRLVDLGYGAFVDSNDQAVIESAARMAVLTMESMVEWRGTKSAADQTLAWPRTGQDAGGVAFSGTPGQVIDCEVMLTAAAEGGPLFLTGGSDRQVVRESSDDASIEYLTSASRHFSLATALIMPFSWRVSFSGYRQVQGARG
jgi:hypothetical protein